MDSPSVLELFRASSAMLEGHFQLSSGLHSDRYFQCALLLEDPARASSLAQELASRIRKKAGQARFDLVIGPALGAVIWAHEVARALGARCQFTERKDGKMELRRGFKLSPGERVLVVEDVLTTGGSTREVIEVMKHYDVRPAAIGAIVNRSGGNPFAKDGLELFALAEVEVKTWKPEECPLCRAGGSAVKPGSRPGAGARA
ncbi:MAG: orotate phosphoribosyltransferase [Planctomycetota bacterium]